MSVVKCETKKAQRVASLEISIRKVSPESFVMETLQFTNHSTKKKKEEKRLV